MSKRPDTKPHDYRFQSHIDKSWDPKLKRGDLFWVFNEKTGKIWGPYNFSHYTYLGAVGWCDVPYNTGVKVRYSRGEVVCGSEEIALERQLLHKVFKYARLLSEAEDLKGEVEQLNNKLRDLRNGA